MDGNHFGAHVRRPVGALLAALCQFGFLPLLAFLLALAFSLDGSAAVAVLLCGCCPGGNLSNLMSLLVDGDMNLRYGAAYGPIAVYLIAVNRVYSHGFMLGPTHFSICAEKIKQREKKTSRKMRCRSLSVGNGH